MKLKQIASLVTIRMNLNCLKISVIKIALKRQLQLTKVEIHAFAVTIRVSVAKVVYQINVWIVNQDSLYSKIVAIHPAHKYHRHLLSLVELSVLPATSVIAEYAKH